MFSVRAKTYKLIRILVAPEDPKGKSYEDLAKLAQNNFTPKPSTIVQRFKFNTRTQQPGETTAVYLKEHCEFGETLDEMLCDRFVCGVRDIRILRRLLAEPKLTLKRALDLALAIEAAEKWAIYLVHARQNRKGSKHHQLLKRSQELARLPTI